MLSIIAGIFVCATVARVQSQEYYYNSEQTRLLGKSDIVLGDQSIISHAVQELHSVGATPDLDACASCKMRLQVAKFVSLSRPDLVTEIFLRWCLESGHDKLSCYLKYGESINGISSYGNDFAKMVRLMKPEGIDGDYYCYYHESECHVMPRTPEVDLSEWWPPKPDVYDAPSGNGNSFNVLHVSDFNVQLDYQVLGESNCSQHFCCKPHSSNSVSIPKGYDYSNLYDSPLGLSFYTSTYRNGYYERGSYLDQYGLDIPRWLPAHSMGAYSCDAPYVLVNNTLKTIRDYHQNMLKFEFAIFTGGTVDHSSNLFIDHETVLNAQKSVYNSMKYYLDRVPVFPTMGTRDVFPVNQFPQKDMPTSPLYQWEFDFLADTWQDNGWLGSEATKQVRYSKIGYSVHTERGLKIISLNSNAWNVENMYVFWNITNIDSFGTWKFLVNELLDSDENDQRVWIIAHLPPSTKTLPVSANVFIQIIERFTPKVIAALFFGHDLKDQFNVIYAGTGEDSKTLKNALNFAFIGPSVSPYTGLNPAWKYYAVDEKNFQIVNAFTYYTKLNDSFVNEGLEPIWDFEYSAREVYDPEDTWPYDRGLDHEFWHQASLLVNSLSEIKRKFVELEYRRSPFIPENCEDDSNNEEYCITSTFTVDQRKQCMITEDQNDYHEPFIDVDYIHVLKPDATPEYKPVHDTLESASPKVFDEEGGSYQNHFLLDTNLMQGQSADGPGLTSGGASENDDSWTTSYTDAKMDSVIPGYERKPKTSLREKLNRSLKGITSEIMLRRR